MPKEDECRCRLESGLCILTGTQNWCNSKLPAGCRRRPRSLAAPVYTRHALIRLARDGVHRLAWDHHAYRCRSTVVRAPCTHASFDRHIIAILLALLMLGVVVPVLAPLVDALLDISSLDSVAILDLQTDEYLIMSLEHEHNMPCLLHNISCLRCDVNPMGGAEIHAHVNPYINHVALDAVRARRGSSSAAFPHGHPWA